MSDDTFTLHRGTRPLLVSLPHVGTAIPHGLRPAFVPRALAVEDTDWHLEAVYGFVRELGASVFLPRLSRYVIDLNRPPENTPMYAGANNTEPVPTRFFTGEALYRDGQAPDAAEIARRRRAFPHLEVGSRRVRAGRRHGCTAGTRLEWPPAPGHPFRIRIRPPKSCRRFLRPAEDMVDVSATASAAAPRFQVLALSGGVAIEACTRPASPRIS